MKGRRLPVWALVVIDLAAAALCVGAVLLVLYILPQGTQAETMETEAVTQFALPSESGEAVPGLPAASQNDWSHADTISTPVDAAEVQAFQAAEKTRETVQEYTGTTAELTIDRVSCTVDGEPVIYYSADVYVSTITSVRTAFAKGMYGRNIRDMVANTARENGAILAISGDSYGESDNTCVIRNGTVYNTDPGTSDVCVLYKDGVMKNFSASVFNEQTDTAGAWQAWTFGPALLDGNGNVLESLHSTEYLNKLNPRAAIGYVAPGHYKLVVVDGRQDGYSVGVTMNQLAALMQEEGCQLAYNLDGGKSAIMVYDNKALSKPVGAGRTISDIIYIPAE